MSPFQILQIPIPSCDMAFEVNRHMIRRLDVLQCSNRRITTPEYFTGSGRTGKTPGFSG
jgi:hypothetical protein